MMHYTEYFSMRHYARFSQIGSHMPKCLTYREQIEETLVNIFYYNIFVSWYYDIRKLDSTRKQYYSITTQQVRTLLATNVISNGR